MSYHSKISSKGQVTLPAALRAEMQWGEGDTLEFYYDHHGRICLRARKPGTGDFLDSLPPKLPNALSDDEAVTAAVLERDDQSRARHDRADNP